MRHPYRPATLFFQNRVGRFHAVCFGLFVLSLLALSSFAQQREQEKATNLKVLDTTLTHDQLIDIMGKYSSALGVECNFCHTRPAPGSREMDFASDSNKVKLVARSMIKMVNAINGTYIKDLPASDAPKVTTDCVTCHHGQPVPRQIQDVLMQARKDHGIHALDSVYRDLRQKYYGSATYDFSDQSLARLGMEVSQENGPDALAILKLNDEFNPKSAINLWVMGRVYTSMGDTANAVASLKKALEINPNNRRAMHDLQMLTGGAPQKP
jgi:hypothetical protein